MNRILDAKGYLWTGQLSCHDVNGKQIDCDNSGQDAGFRRGIPWPDHRFENDNGIVLDKLTGLRWSANANPAEFPLTWQQALDYVHDLNLQGYLGFNDWRVPNRRELRSLMDLQCKKPALAKNHPFENVFQSWYWTSTTAVISPAHAWYIHLEGARMFYGGKDQSYFVWPVRGSHDSVLPATGQKKCYDTRGECIPCENTGQDAEYQSGIHWEQSRLERFDDTVYDRLTRLLWSGNASLTKRPVSWPEALLEIEKFNQRQGEKRWRLPNINELESLVDCGRARPALVQADLFSDLQDSYWSSTTSMFEPDWAWALYLEKGAVGVGQKSGRHFYVWPVCDGV